MSANRIDLARVQVDELARALHLCMGQLEVLDPDPGTVTRQIHEHAQSTLATLQHTLADHDAEHREKLRTGEIKPVSVDTETRAPAESLRGALECFGGPLRLATLCLESATDDDLTALERLHVLDLACCCDDWKSRSEARMLEFEKSGPEKSGTG